MPSKNPMTGVNSITNPQGQVLLGSNGALPMTFGTSRFVSTLGSDQLDGLSTTSPYATIQKAVNNSNPGDVIYIAPGSYNESVQFAFADSYITLIGLGAKGSVAIAPSTAAAHALTFNCNGLVCVNIDFASPTGATYTVSGTGSACRFYSCKFEGADTSGASFNWGPGSVANIAAGLAGRGGDLQLYDCEFAWTYNGVTFTASDFGQATEIYMEDCWFHDTSATSLLGVPGAFGIGSVGDLTVVNCVFSRAEDGTKPSDFVNVNDAADVGSFSGNRFALATNAAADLKVGAKVLWMANATEAGWSAARPA